MFNMVTGLIIISFILAVFLIYSLYVLKILREELKDRKRALDVIREYRGTDGENMAVVVRCRECDLCEMCPYKTIRSSKDGYCSLGKKKGGKK